MFLPKSLIELEAILPLPLPPTLRRFLARRPQGNDLGDLYFYGRGWVLERYRERLESGGEPFLLPIARNGAGELTVDIRTMEVLLFTGETPSALAPDFTSWLAGLRADRKEANNKKLVRAARAGDLSKIQRLLARGADINEQDAAGNSPLSAALLAWQYEAAALLLRHHPNLSLRDRTGHTALHWACYRNQAALVQQMIAMGADVHTRTDAGEGALYFALTGPRPAAEGGLRGSKEIVEILLQSGLHIDAPQLPGDKPISEIDPAETDTAHGIHGMHGKYKTRES